MPGGGIVSLARDGDREAFALLVARHDRLVRALAALYVGARDAPDAAQEIWLSVHRKLWQLDDGDRFVPWLRTLIFHHCLNHRRRRGRREGREVMLDGAAWARLAECVADGSDGMAEALERRALRRWVGAELDRLPALYRETLRLRHYHGLSYARIAELTGVPVSAVKWRLHQGRRLLAARLAPVVQTGRVST